MFPFGFVRITFIIVPGNHHAGKSRAPLHLTVSCAENSDEEQCCEKRNHRKTEEMPSGLARKNAGWKEEYLRKVRAEY